MTDDYCFNLTRCTPDGALKVYAHRRKKYNSRAYQLVSHVAEKSPDTVIHVNDPSEACLLVVSCNSHGDFRQLADSDEFGDGQNYLVWEATSCFGFGDYPFDKVNFRKAAVATSTRMDANLRKGYDVAIARVRGMPVSEFAVNASVFERVQKELGLERRWLLAYKGKTHNLKQVWWQHRWLAYEFWDPNDEKVAVDLICRGNRGVMEKVEYTGGYDYVELLSNSTFAFCPGGGSTQSYRFAEALGLGAIPVVTAELIPPFSPEIKWEDCLIRVSEARIVDLPRLLRQIPLEEVHRRQRRCFDLFGKTIGWVRDNDTIRIDSDTTMFTTAMEVWKWRVRHEYRMRDMKKELERDFLSNE